MNGIGFGTWAWGNQLVWGYDGQRDDARLQATFRHIDGVTPGTDVLLAGIPVGEVEKQYLDTATNSAVVIMRIRDGIGIPYDSSVKILSEGMAGRKYLKIAPGGDPEMLPPGGSLEFTQGSLRFEELLQKVILAAEARRAEEAANKGDGSNAPAGAGQDNAPDGGNQDSGLGGFGLPGLSLD